MQQRRRHTIPSGRFSLANDRPDAARWASGLEDNLFGVQLPSEPQHLPRTPDELLGHVHALRGHDARPAREDIVTVASDDLRRRSWSGQSPELLRADRNRAALAHQQRDLTALLGSTVVPTVDTTEATAHKFHRAKLAGKRDHGKTLRAIQGTESEADRKFRCGERATTSVDDDVLREDVLHGIDRPAVDVDLVMKMRPRRPPGNPDLGNDLSPSDDLPHLCEEPLVVGITGLHSASVVDLQGQAVIAIGPGEDHLARSGRPNGSPAARAKI